MPSQTFSTCITLLMAHNDGTCLFSSFSTAFKSHWQAIKSTSVLYREFFFFPLFNEGFPPSFYSSFIKAVR